MLVKSIQSIHSKGTSGGFSWLVVGLHAGEPAPRQVPGSSCPRCCILGKVIICVKNTSSCSSKSGIFLKLMNLFLLSKYTRNGGWRQNSAPTQCDPPAVRLRCSKCPSSEGCCLWELGLGCGRWIIKRKLATEERALWSTGAQQSLLYLYHGAISLKWVICSQPCEALSRIV